MSFSLSLSGFTSGSKTDPGAFSLAGYTNTGQVCLLCFFYIPAFIIFILAVFLFYYPFSASLVYPPFLTVFVSFLFSRFCSFLLLLFTLLSFCLPFILLHCIFNIFCLSSSWLLLLSTDISPTRLCCCRMLWFSRAAPADQSLWVTDHTWAQILFTCFVHVFIQDFCIIHIFWLI